MTYQERFLHLMSEAGLEGNPDLLRLALLDSLLVAEMLIIVEDIIERPFAPEALLADYTVGDLIRLCDQNYSIK